MALDIINNDLRVNGTLSALYMTIPAAAVDDSAIEGSAGIDATKLEQQRNINLSQLHGTAATSERRVVYTAIAAGEITSVAAGLVVAAVGAATVTVDVLKNGTTVLTGVITLDSANVAYTEESGTLSVTSLAAGDNLEVVLVATAGGGTLPQGVYVQIVLTELPA